MTYNKPEVVKLDSALKAIQSGLKGFPVQADSITTDQRPTNAAYEADE